MQTHAHTRVYTHTHAHTPASIKCMSNVHSRVQMMYEVLAVHMQTYTHVNSSQLQGRPPEEHFKHDTPHMIVTRIQYRTCRSTHMYTCTPQELLTQHTLHIPNTHILKYVHTRMYIHAHVHIRKLGRHISRTIRSVF